MKNIIKNFSVLFAVTVVAIICLVFSVSAVPFEDLEYSSSGQCGENVSYHLNELTGELYITGSGDMYEQGLNNFMFNALTIRKIYIDAGITWVDAAAFAKSSTLTYIVVDSNNRYYSNDGFGALFDKNKKTLLLYPGGSDATSYTIPNGVTAIAGEAFYNCINLTDIRTPDSLTTIDEWAFEHCGSLRNITLGKGLKSIGRRAFDYCVNLQSIIIPDSVTSVGEEAFKDCKNLENVIIGKGITSISEGVFLSCEKLEKVTIPSGVTSIGDSAFSSCGSLESITFPDSVKSIGNNAFYICSNLKSITFGKGVTSIGDHAFGACEKLKNLIIPDNVKTIGDFAFGSCSLLETATIGDGVRSIGGYAFYCCYALKSVTVGVSVKSIGQAVFSGCDELKDIYFNGTKAQWNEVEIKSGNEDLLNATVHFSGSTGDEPVRPVKPSAPAKIIFASNESKIQLAWSASAGADGYRVFYKSGNAWKVSESGTHETTYTFKNLKAGTKYTFAVRPYVIVDGNVVWGDYVTITASTRAVAPAKVASAQNASAIKLAWTDSPGATGYRIYYKSGNTWKAVVSTTNKTSYTFKNLRSGARFTFAIRPYVIVGKTVLWSAYTVYTAATAPATVTAKATSSASGRIDLSWSQVSSTDGYVIYYRAGNGAFKPCKVVNAYTKSLSFSNLRSGTTYTFVVRAAVRKTDGIVQGGYKETTVTVK